MTCRPHRTGIGPEAPPFFIAGCEVCERKKAAGKVTGDEGPLPINWNRARMVARGRGLSTLALLPFPKSRSR